MNNLRLTQLTSLKTPHVTVSQGVKLTLFFGSQLAPNYPKVVANSKKLVVIMTHTKKHFPRFN